MPSKPPRSPDEQRAVCHDLIWARGGTEGALPIGDASYDPLHHFLAVFADGAGAEGCD